MAGPCWIWNISMFGPSLVCEASASLIGSLLPINMASADFLTYRKRIYFKTSLGKSFCLRPIPTASTTERCFILWTLQWCACLSPLNSLIYRFCSSVPDFVVSLPSVLVSRQTTLRLTNTSERYLSVWGTYTLWEKEHSLKTLLYPKICIFEVFPEGASPFPNNGINIHWGNAQKY